MEEEEEREGLGVLAPSPLLCLRLAGRGEGMGVMTAGEEGVEDCTGEEEEEGEGAELRDFLLGGRGEAGALIVLEEAVVLGKDLRLVGLGEGAGGAANLGMGVVWAVLGDELRELRLTLGEGIGEE